MYLAVYSLVTACSTDSQTTTEENLRQHSNESHQISKLLSAHLKNKRVQVLPIHLRTSQWLQLPTQTDQQTLEHKIPLKPGL